MKPCAMRRGRTGDKPGIVVVEVPARTSMRAISKRREGLTVAEMCVSNPGTRQGYSMKKLQISGCVSQITCRDGNSCLPAPCARMSVSSYKPLGIEPKKTGPGTGPRCSLVASSDISVVSCGPEQSVSDAAASLRSQTSRHLATRQR